MASPTATELEQRLQQIAQRLTPCPIPDVSEGWDLCAHGLPWPCPSTEAAWLARGLDRTEQVGAQLGWLRGERAGAHTDASLEIPELPSPASDPATSERRHGA
jgi:hypothetical protein